MEILNPSPSLCLPQAMWIVFDTVARRDDVTSDDVLDLVVPVAIRKSTPGNGGHVNRALKALLELELLTRDGDFLKPTIDDNGPGSFLRVLRYRLTSPPSDFGPEFSGAPDLRDGLIWLLRRSPFAPLDWQDVEKTQLKQVFVNDTRWNAFMHWTKALGLGRPAPAVVVEGSKKKTTGEKVVPDPTEAVIDVIRNPIGEALPVGSSISISVLLEFLRRELPVLPGHSSAVVDEIPEDSSDELRALGLALSCAEERGLLSMTYQADPSGVLALPDARDYGNDRFVSAVTIIEE
ncbi:hypothetical protein GP2_055_00140 [Gordonia paraffinivorans NBRC 108238]|uniref:Uncharacterized protein n=1 Tax=Gordonia paraffinivorans NBRC 108238 TaxID=1223543 RepID=A0ABQ0IRD9_9ACTN|nr:hypothetical protein [Gordonia paraffinivorans]GAC86131.1 hypothetical protein GP2_055_00140 [Gordonia paraffinivorans NBRC 108238]